MHWIILLGILCFLGTQNFGRVVHWASYFIGGAAIIIAMFQPEEQAKVLIPIALGFAVLVVLIGRAIKYILSDE